MSFYLSLGIYGYVFDVLDMTEQETKVEARYWFIVSLKQLRATENFE